MNVDIESLNEEEFRKLCESIGASAFKNLFEKFPEDFSKIYSVFRAKNLKADKVIDLAIKNLKDDKVIDLAVKNRDKKFIVDFVRSSKKIMDDFMGNSLWNVKEEIVDFENINTESSAHEYKGKIYNITDYVINVDDKHDIHISETMRIGNKDSMVDIRLYSMFAIDGIYDGKKKATSRGIHFNFKYLHDVIKNLISIYEIHESKKFNEDFQSIAAEKWRIDNEQIINQMESKISALKHNLEEQDKISKELEKEIVDKQSTLDKIIVDIESKKKLASEVEIKVSQKIETAKMNVADFICEMLFINNQVSGVQPVQAITENRSYIPSQVIESEHVQEDEDLKDFVGTLDTELGLQGVSNEYVLSFAAYLCAAYKNKILLLLAGPNGRDIADAFSVSLNGKTAAVFDCAKVNSFSDLNICRDSEDEVIAVLNPFAPNFIAYLPELINIENKFIFAIYPFAEDLRIEPRSLYNYFLPVLTELIVDKRPARDFDLKYSNEKIKAELKKTYSPDIVPISAEKRIKKLVRDAQEILEANFKKDFIEQSVLFARFPLAYVKGKGENFLEEFNGDEKVGEAIRNFLEGVE